MNKKPWKYYIRLYHKDYVTLAFVILVTLIQTGLHFGILYSIQKIFDGIAHSLSLTRLMTTCIVIVSLYLFLHVLSLWVRYVILKITKNVIQSIRQSLLEKLYQLPFGFAADNDMKKLHTVIVHDTERVDIMSNALFAQFCPAVLFSVLIGCALAYFSLELTLISASAVPLFFFVNRSVGKKTKKKVRGYRNTFDTFNNGILSVLERLDLTKIKSSEKREVESQTERFRHLNISSRNMAWLQAAYGVIQNNITFIYSIVLLIIGGYFIKTGQMSLGSFISFYIGLSLLRSHLTTVFYCLPQIIEGNESLLRIYGFLSEKEEECYQGTRKIRFSGRVLLENISFGFSSHLFLKEINLEINPGEVVVINGENGTGKTTLINLILGFYKPYEGTISLDGYPLEEIDVHELRKQIGVLRQNPLIFSGTVRENISYGNIPTDEEKIFEAAGVSGAHSYIETLPEKYDTRIENNLSGGERQKIALARAFLHHPNLIILDEPTNNLDEASKENLLEHLKNLPHKPAILIMTHDVEMMAKADFIYELKDHSLVLHSAEDINLSPGKI
jgi:ABC-type bacteriocin/lantibiotic exporter with double-glycine peptidase domain